MDANKVKNTPTVTQSVEHARAFGYFNRTLFGGKLPDGMLAFNRPKNQKTLAFCVFAKWAKDGNKVNEISINPEIFKGNDARFIFSQLVRQMVNHWQMTVGFTTAPNGRLVQSSALTYTNQENADRCKLAGLLPFKTGKDGKVVKDKETGQGIQVSILKDGAFDKAFDAMPEDIRFPWNAVPEYVKPRTESDNKSPGRVKYTGRVSGNTVNAWAAPGMSLAVRVGKRYVQLLEASEQVRVAA